MQILDAKIRRKKNMFDCYCFSDIKSGTIIFGVRVRAAAIPRFIGQNNCCSSPEKVLPGGVNGQIQTR